MEIKVNMECALRILEKNGFDVENNVKAGSPLIANKKVNEKDHDKVELFQVRCSSPYVKFEAKIDNEMQQGIIKALNQGLDSLVKGAQARQKDEVSSPSSHTS
jgi:hypothetical protein